MSLPTIKNALRPHLHNLRGFKLKRKVLALQSDDWGAIRTSSRTALKDLKSLGIPVEDCHYTRFDALEGKDDLTAIFEILQSVRDQNGNAARLTANCLVANPDFEEIERQAFAKYVPESVKRTFQRSERTSGADRLWLEGYEAGIFYPQSHSREHFNVARWMGYLESGKEIFRVLFNHGMFGLSSFLIPGKPNSYLSALQSPAPGEPDERETILVDGMRMFREIFGFDSRSFIAPNYVWDDLVENALLRLGVPFIQTAAVQQPAAGIQNSLRIRRFQGQRNRNDQIYLMRNVHFEPASDPSVDWVARSMREISAAFFWNKPAILSTHRVNYIGALDESNRQRGLSQLKRLLDAVVKRWPMIEFVTTTELGDLIRDGDSR